ncbi:protein Aster-C-like [Homarus americanus]|uniref:protein Aster-C-like n=1 Tax=Homarus americanus TaxID=6706 RepID=UPI001C48C059|nr:protein Aster-C-like [Homarus americanus]
MKLEEVGDGEGEDEEQEESFYSEVDEANSEIIHPTPLSYLAQTDPTRGSTIDLDGRENEIESDDASSTRQTGSRLLEVQHQGKEVINSFVHLPVDTVFNLVFLHDRFMADVLSARKVTDIMKTPWQEQEDGRRVREVTYTMSLSISSITSKASNVTERQVVQESRAGYRYVVETEVFNTGIPHGDDFTVLNYYCFTSAADHTTIITVWSRVMYKKTPWGLMKVVLEKNTYSGVEALMAELLTQLVTEEERTALVAMGRRRRIQSRAYDHDDKVEDNSHDHDHDLAHATEEEILKEPPASESDKVQGWAGVVVVTALLVLLVGNALLYTKLTHLEHLARHHPPPPSLPHRQVGVKRSWEEVARVLRRQEELHQHHQRYWKTTIHHVSLKLQEVHKNLEVVLSTIPKHEESLRQVLLQQCDLFEGLQGEDNLQHELEDHLDHDVIYDQPQEPRQITNTDTLS